MIFEIGIVVLLELIMLFHVSRNVQFYNPILFMIAVPFYYANSFYFDYLISGFDLLESPATGLSLSIYSANYLYVVLLTFLYILGVYLTFLSKNTRYSFSERREYMYSDVSLLYRSNNLLIVSILICILILSFFTLESVGLDRYEQKLLFTPLRTIISQFSFIYLCLVVVTVRGSRKIATYTMFIFLLLYSFLNYEREFILMIFYAFLIKSKPTKIKVYQISALFLMLILLIYYKSIMMFSYSVLSGGDLSFMSVILDKEATFSFSDPAVSILLVSDFINDSAHYAIYYGSYLSNTIMQFIRTFISSDWQSLGEYSTIYFTQGEMGTAFSMIVESMLNFWYFGPFIIGFLMAFSFFKSEKYCSRFLYAVYFMWFVFIFKIIRTELAVVLKIYILPALIAMYILSKILKLNKAGIK